MAIPIATGLASGDHPARGAAQLLQVAAALVLSALAIALFNITRNLAILRVETQVSGPLQAAVWDRLLRLPAASSASIRRATWPRAQWPSTRSART